MCVEGTVRPPIHLSGCPNRVVTLDPSLQARLGAGERKGGSVKAILEFALLRKPSLLWTYERQALLLKKCEEIDGWHRKNVVEETTTAIIRLALFVGKCGSLRSVQTNKRCSVVGTSCGFELVSVVDLVWPRIRWLYR